MKSQWQAYFANWLPSCCAMIPVQQGPVSLMLNHFFHDSISSGDCKLGSKALPGACALFIVQ
jgi:hypothetical protein